MKIVVGCDHGGYDLKDELAARLRQAGHEVADMGCNGPESVDYPDYAEAVGHAVVEGRAERGLLVCGSGIGMCIAANRIAGVRAVNASEPYTAKMSRRHNDSNVLCLGGRFVGRDLAAEILDTWLNEPFEGGRHQRRIDLIDHVIRKPD